MKKVQSNSKQNKYLFLEGDYVFELERPQAFTKEFVAFFSNMFDMFHVSWEVNVDSQSKMVPVIALHSAPLYRIIQVITLYQAMFKNNITDSYQII